MNCLGEVAYFQAGLRTGARVSTRSRTSVRHRRRRNGPGSHVPFSRSRLLRPGQVGPGRSLFELAHTLWLKLGDKREQAITTVALGRLQVRRGNYQTALNHFQGALGWLEPMGDAVWEGSAVLALHRVYLDMGEIARAVEHWERSVQLFETAGSRSLPSIPLCRLAPRISHRVITAWPWPLRTSVRASPTSWVSSGGRPGRSDLSVWCTSFGTSRTRLAQYFDRAVEVAATRRRSSPRSPTACGSRRSQLNIGNSIEAASTTSRKR